MKIGNREIGPNHPPLVIAEIGINHGGSLAVAKEMVGVSHGNLVMFYSSEGLLMVGGGSITQCVMSAPLQNPRSTLFRPH